MHEYDDNWRCKCGYRLIADYDQKTGRMNVKAYVTPEGETVPLGESSRRSEKPVRQAGHKHHVR
jgi:hypothetical protein